MLYHQNLEELIFQRHEILDTDELIVLSGYLGPTPVERLEELPLSTRVIYGMYGSEGIQTNLHNSLRRIQHSVKNLNIFYSQIPVHSKCYAWRKNGQIIHALIGSANFSINGLTTPYREILAETTKDTYNPLNEYISHIFNNSISCLEIGLRGIQEKIRGGTFCDMSFLMDNGETHNASGLNWGFMANGLPSPKRGINDACIPISISHIRQFPDLFPPKLTARELVDIRGRRQRSNEAIELIWDDGITMEGLLEGTNNVDGVEYPKQISSFPAKNQMGEYLKMRLAIPLGQPIRKHHLVSYGRTDVTISLIGDGIYSCDFSV
ncbi:restriction endonuclease PLD domain-containing protein [Halpernia frigidisoli]|uniref:NgoFVII restriction endonuclease n=1 Tax=Halpernia frigidisoli TaxID=1125876 RepID=A0A1I3G1Q6_9FLAO|nr:restriction endonuclease PLD domain-containing protein [Halpernia frigidisoli]SFI17389.1 NgoFVII restriction endonuclease [Halpernia frigidisoli]